MPEFDTGYVRMNRHRGLLAFALCLAAFVAGCGGGEIHDAISSAAAGNGTGGAVQAVDPGLRLTYLRQMRDGEETELRSMRVNGSDDHLLDSAAVIGEVAASANSSEVYYIRADDLYYFYGWEVYSASTSGGGTTRRTNNTYPDFHVCPLANGSVYYSESWDMGDDNYQGDVFKFAPGGAAQVTNTSTFGVWFDVSPNEDFIVYLDSSVSARNLYKYDVATGIETLLVNDPEYISKTFRISPDSSKILYLTDCSTSGVCKNFYVINASGGAVMSKTNTVAMFGAWSPDGTRFAVTQVEMVGSEARAVVNIYTVSTGAKSTILTSADLYYFISDWSPDGATLAGWAGSSSTDKSELFTMKTDGSGLVKLTNASAGEYFGKPLFTR